MINKCLLILTTLLCYGSVRGEQVTYYNGGDLDMETPPGREQCNTTYCDMPCPSSMPPPYCPKKVLNCPTGCMCMFFCEYNSVVCFMTQYCKDHRRFLKKQPFKPRITSENPNYYQF